MIDAPVRRHCVNCVYHHHVPEVKGSWRRLSQPAARFCTHPNTADPVTGRSHTHCSECRKGHSDNEHCGKEGRWFVKAAIRKSETVVEVSKRYSPVEDYEIPF